MVREERDEAGADRPEWEEATEQSTLSADFPSVPGRDIGVDHTRDVDPPPNTGEDSQDVSGPPG